MPAWRDILRVDPLPALLAVDDDALRYFVRRDLLGEAVEPVESLWEHPALFNRLVREFLGG